MGALCVVVMQPFIKIDLQRVDVGIDRFAEGNLIKLLQDGFVEAFADAVGLGRLYLGFGVVDVVDGQEELIVMLISPPAVFGASVCHDAQDGELMLLIEGQHTVIEHIGCRDRRFGGVELGVGDL